jgi:AcrR family transcriptional regulator
MKSLERRSRQAENILHAAKLLFARQGYHGTTTREIARLADIAENTLFRYFEHKEDLFWAVLHSSLSGVELRLAAFMSAAEGASPEIVLPKLFTQLIDTIILKPELPRLVAIAFVELPGKAPSAVHQYLSPIISTVNSYMAKFIERGTFRNLNSSLVTSAMISMVLGYPAISGLIPGAEPAYSDSKEAVRAYSKFWLEILAPPILNPFRTGARSGESPEERK